LAYLLEVSYFKVEINSLLLSLHFIAWFYAQRGLSVSLSVCHYPILSKRLNVSWKSFQLAPSF